MTNKLEIECIESKVSTPREHYGKFVLQPLSRGQGITVGNALRRVLLSDLEGTAITSARIAGVSHEFSTISGVREDVLELLLNLKEVVFKRRIKHPTIGRLKIQGPAIVTTGDLDLPLEIEVVDPKQYIATISNNNILEIEFTVKTGQGYQIVERTLEDSNNDFLEIDAVFMPAKKVSYSVEEIRDSQHVLMDKLVFEVWTNGSLSPQEAIGEASTVLTNLFNPLKNIHFKAKEENPVLEKTQIKQISIEELQLPVRAYNCLKRAQIHSVGDLLAYSQEELLKIKNFGQKSAEEVIEALQKKLSISLPKEKNLKNK